MQRQLCDCDAGSRPHYHYALELWVPKCDKPRSSTPQEEQDDSGDAQADTG